MKFILSFIIYLLCILQIKGDKASKVVNFVKSKVGCGYVWGGEGQKLTEALLNKFHDQYPTHVDKSIVKRWIGKEVYDCSGLVHVAFKNVGISIYHNADTAWRTTNWKNTGGISNYPRDKVHILYRKSDNKMVHTGVYIGGGKFIHAKGSKEGVVMENMPGTWTNWGIPNGLY